MALFLLSLVVILSLLFTYSIGFQDGSGVAASALKARAMTRKQAVALVSAFEFTGAILGGSAVANAIRDITSWSPKPDLLLVLASSLSAAIIWNFTTRSLGVPTSSTHALVGALLGSIFASGSSQMIRWGSANMIMDATGVWRVILSLILSPLAGFLAGLLLFKLLAFLLRNATTKVNKKLNRLEWLMVPALAFGHGTNETQKTMAIIVMALHSVGLYNGEGVPIWVRLAAATCISAGILTVAPKLVRRIGGIYKQRPLHGFVSQFSSAAIVLGASITGGPISSSQVIASAIVGVGSAARIKGVQWQVARDIVRAWFLTIPCSGLVAYLLHVLIFSHLNNYL